MKSYETTARIDADPVRVTDFQPGSAMTWRGGMPLGLFRGVPTFRLTPRDGGIDLTVREARFARGLEQRAEAGAR
jgi:hypothetical protein